MCLSFFELNSLLGASHLIDYISVHIRFDLERYLLIIALLTNNMGFGPGSRTVIRRSRHVINPICSLIDWLAGPKIRIVGLSFAECKMDETVHVKLYLPLSGRGKHQLQ